jgi:hypothetical protein
MSVQKSLEIHEYQEMLKKAPLFALGKQVYCLPGEFYPGEIPPLACIIIGIELKNKKWNKGWHYTLIYLHEHEEQTDQGEWTVWNLIEEDIPEHRISEEKE